MAWEVQLVGDSTDLRLLSDSLASGDPRIVLRDGAFFIRSTAFDQAATAGAAREMARPIAESLSGVAALLLGARTSIELGNVVRVGPDGSPQHMFLIGAPAEAYARALPGVLIMSHADGRQEVHRPADLAPQWLAKAATNLVVAKALRLRQRHPLDWVGLYRLLEVIYDSVPASIIASRGWASKAALGRFEHTANSVGAVGDEARHGLERTQPPARPMTLREARLLVDSIVRSWLDSDLA
jgi:hypothetical protein